MSTTKTGIEWTDRTWNPTRGCSRISPGCINCYAETIAARFSDKGQPFHLYADRKKSGSKWTGDVGLIESALLEPRKWKKPAKIFVNSMSDLFHEDLPDRAIDCVFAVMAQCPQHTFQVLTKRAGRLHSYCKAIQEMEPMQRTMRFVRSQYAGHPAESICVDGLRVENCGRLHHWPLPNVHLGVRGGDSGVDHANSHRTKPLANGGCSGQWDDYQLIGPDPKGAYRRVGDK